MINIRNIKISIKTQVIALNNAIHLLQESGISVRVFPNFITFKASSFAFVLFKPSKNSINHLNASCLKSEDDVEAVKTVIRRLLNVQIFSSTIDNIVSTVFLEKTIDLYKVIESALFENVKYNPEKFPGLFAKFTKGTIILFHSGKIVIVGCKSHKDIKCVLMEALAHLKPLL